MNITQVSFGQKIPKYTCKIQNKQTGKLEPATFYEVDCKDEDDYERIRNLDKHWVFTNNLSDDMTVKHVRERYLHKKSNNSFYIIENKAGEVVGVSEIENDDNFHNVKYIESEPHNKYKYVGQNMMAGIGKEFLDKRGIELTVLAPVDDAMPFYKRLGFECFGGFSFRMCPQGANAMIKNVERRTKSKLIDINA